MRSVLALTAALALRPVPVLAQSLEGAWKPVEVVITGGANPGRHTSDVQPGLIIFTKRHYSEVLVVAFSPRPALSSNPTDEERGRVFRPLNAEAGMYEMKDSTLTFTPFVAKNPAAMTGTPYSLRARVHGDSLWVNTRSPDGGVATWKWVRAEDQ